MKTLVAYLQAKCRKCDGITESKFKETTVETEKEEILKCNALIYEMYNDIKKETILTECKSCKMYTLQDYIGCRIVDRESGSFIGNLMKYFKW